MRSNAWTKEDDEFIKANIDKLEYQQIAYRLGRTKIAVRSRASQLGIKKTTPTGWKKNKYFDTRKKD